MRFLLFALLVFTNVYAISTDANAKISKQISSADSFDSEFAISDKQNATEVDPLSSYNKAMTSFNDFFYKNILNPVAKVYKAILPKPLRKGIYNLYDNLLYPIRLVNNLLQLKFKHSFLETQRFLLNSTVGLGGLIDVANDKFHIKQYQEDFGQTLGFYGVGSGFYIVWPILGPSNVRDSIGLITDAVINPLTYIKNRGYNIFDSSFQATSARIGDIIDYSSLHVGDYEKLTKDAIDLYPFLKNVYEQRRKKEILE